MTNQQIADALDYIGRLAGEAAKSLAPTGIPGIVAGLTEIAFSSAAAFARAGKSPVEEIRRIHEADPLLQTVRAEFEEFIKANFHEKSAPPADQKTDDPYPTEE